MTRAPATKRSSHRSHRTAVLQADPLRLVQSAFALSALLTVACTPAAHEVPAPPVADAPSSSFAWVAVQPSNRAIAEEYPARLLRTSLSEAVVVPPLPAQLLRLLVRPGDTVLKDAPIAEVVMPELDAALASFNGATSALEVLTRRRAQLLSLQGEGLVRGADLASLELELARQTTERLRAQAVLSAARSTGGGKVLLRSPLGGVVIEVPAVVGELRRPEDGPLARIQNRTGQRIEATFQTKPVPEASYSFLTESGSVPLRLLNSLPATNGLGYLAWFETPEGTEMPTASQGRVAIERSAAPDAYLVPASAVGTERDAHFVVVRTKASPAPVAVAVEVLRAAKTEALVRGALPEGALVASDPARALPTKVTGAAR